MEWEVDILGNTPYNFGFEINGVAFITVWGAIFRVELIKR